MTSIDSSSCAFELAMVPPANETPNQRAARIQLEKEATQRSKQIDADLKASKAALKRYQKAVKVLVLGQSLSGASKRFFSRIDIQVYSGKSTTIKSEFALVVNILPC